MQFLLFLLTPCKQDRMGDIRCRTLELELLSMAGHGSCTAYGIISDLCMPGQHL